VQLAKRSPLFDTAIINLYHPGDGITPHVDLLRFADGIAIVSLGEPAIMNFTPEGDCEVGGEVEGGLQQQQQQQLCGNAEQQQCQQLQQSPPVPQQRSKCWQQQQQHSCHHQLLLQGGDLLLLHGAARYRWRHGIAAVAEEVLLCASCKAAATGHGQAGLGQAAAAAAGAGLLASNGAQHSSMRQHLQPHAQCSAAAVHVQSFSEADKARPVGDREACRLCVRVVRGRRVSLTLRRLDPGQSMLDMQ
jgi:hypothetical protein